MKGWKTSSPPPLSSRPSVTKRAGDEDLVTHKAFAGRDRDWADVEGVLTRQYGKIDLALIRAELRPLLDLKGEPESLDRLERLIAAVEGRLRR